MCVQAQEEYMACLKAANQDASACQGLAKKYLQCRMEK